MANMISKSIIFGGQPCILACDGKCEKAWGINNRPKLYKSVDGQWIDVAVSNITPELVPNEDDNVLLADGELGVAPADPGTYEGGQGKPENKDQNKWCSRECERSVIVDEGEPTILPDFSKRLYNMPQIEA